MYLMFLAVTVIDVCLNFTGLSKFVAIDVYGSCCPLIWQGWINPVPVLCTIDHDVVGSPVGNGDACGSRLCECCVVDGSLVGGLGHATFTAHMFIFYFAVASAITPPVALAPLRIDDHQGRTHGDRVQRRALRIVMFAIPSSLRFTQSCCWSIKP